MTPELTEQIVSWVVAVMPSIISVLTTVGIIIKIAKEIKSLKKEVVDMKDIEEIKRQLQALSEENYELKKTLNETLTVLTKVKRS